MSDKETPPTAPPSTMQILWDPHVNLHFATLVSASLPDRNAREDIAYSPYTGLPIALSDNVGNEPVIAVVVTPPAPTNLAATPGSSQVGLSWTAVPSGVGAAASYDVYRGTATGAESGTPLATGITGTTYTDSTAVTSTEYWYVVKAVNVAGTGPASDEVHATPT